MTEGFLHDKTIGFLVLDGFEHQQLAEPAQHLRDDGADVVLISVHLSDVQSFQGLIPRQRITPDAVVTDVHRHALDALIIPGGEATREAARERDDVVGFVRTFLDSGRPVGAICRAVETLVAADVLDGRSVTSWPSLQAEVIAAGGRWIDRRVVVDGNLVTSRDENDLPAFTLQLEALLDR